MPLPSPRDWRGRPTISTEFEIALRSDEELDDGEELIVYRDDRIAQWSDVWNALSRQLGRTSSGWDEPFHVVLDRLIDAIDPLFRKGAKRPKLDA